MNLVAKTFAAILPLALVACADTQDQPPKVAQPHLALSNVAMVRVGQLDSGFLFFGNTSINVISVDGNRRDNPGQPLQLPPGSHTFLVTAFRDPVLAYACLTAPLEAGKSYVVETTKPYLEGTTMWIEDSATGATSGAKVSAQIMRQPVMFSPALNHLLFGSPPHQC
jgi:hypothetical protein